MQVFSPAQAKTATEERTAKDALRAKNLASITQELLNERSQAERDFEQTMKLQQEISEKWFEENTIRKNELLREVEKLEERRRIALMPPLIKEKDIHSVSEALHARKLVLDAQEAQNEEESRLLMRKLDSASTREQSLDEREARVKRSELGAESQRNQVANDLKRLNLQLAEFQKRVEDKETEFAYRQSELDAKENLYQERERGFEKREEEIESAKRLLADHRILLEKGFEELRRLKNK